MVDLTIGVLARPDVKLLPTIYRQLGKDYLERVLPSIATEVIKSVVVSFNPEEREGNTGNSPPEGGLLRASLPSPPCSLSSRSLIIIFGVRVGSLGPVYCFGTDHQPCHRQ